MAFLNACLCITHRLLCVSTSQEYSKPVNREPANLLMAKILIAIINTLGEARWHVMKIVILFDMNNLIYFAGGKLTE